MEAAFVSLLIEKLGGIAVEQAQSRCFLLLRHTTPPLDQIHARLERITAEFKMMQAFLACSTAAAAADKALEAGIEQVREDTFKIEDIIEEYFYLVGRQRVKTWKNCCPMAPFSLAKAWRSIDSRLEKLERDLSELLGMRVRYGLTIRGNEDRVKNSERETHHYQVYSPMLIDEDDLVGIEENKSKLISWLTNAGTRRKMTAISVLGMDGHGKTTLVSNVYLNNTVKSHFDCQVWVTVSQNYSAEELLRKMIQQIFKEKKEPVPNGITTMQGLQLVDIIKESLQRKRYMIVLDDISREWNPKWYPKSYHYHVDLCNDIIRTFVDSNNGSRLIVTTRMHEVARMVNDEHMIKLQQLNEKDAWILFCKKAFRRENNNVCPQEFEDYARKILNKCQGSPLAIAVIGSLLSTKEKSESGWKEVYDCLDEEFEKNSSLDALKSILNLSFNDLPKYLKNCFVYCSIFPDDYIIKRKKLLRLWVAEGFVEARSSNRSMEEEAEDYLAELVDRSMLQVVERTDFGRLKSFRMHDVVREVTLEISTKMKFCMILKGSPSVLDNQTRRLSIQTNDESLVLDKSLRSRSRLCSLIMFSCYKLSERSLRAVLTSFKMFRVLELEATPIPNLPNEVFALFNLHYLGLRFSEVQQLPNKIQKLQSLQTLDLRDSKIKKLPRGVTQLKQLRHLFVTKIYVGFEPIEVDCPTVEVAGEWQWKNLQTLQGVKANEKLVQRLGDMKELRSLSVVEVKQAHCPQLCTSLTTMSNLRTLCLLAGSEEQLDFDKLNYPSPPLKTLEKLDLRGRLFEEKLPRFICSCAGLTRVRLMSSQLIEDPLPSLGQLPKLVELNLGSSAYKGQKMHFESGFRALKSLYLKELKNLNDIKIDEGAMASLHELVLIALPNLKMVPGGIQFLTGLQSFSVYDMPEELVEKLRNDDDNEDRRRIRHIPRVIIDYQ